MLLLVNEEAGSAIEITLFVSEEDRSNTEEDGGMLERKLELLADRLDEPPRIEAHELKIISLAATNFCRRDCLCNARTACNTSSVIHPRFIAPCWDSRRPGNGPWPRGVRKGGPEDLELPDKPGLRIGLRRRAGEAAGAASPVRDPRGDRD